MPYVLKEWSPPAALIDGLSAGHAVGDVVAETKASFAHFLTESGVPVAHADAAADALIGKIVSALARGEPPESAITGAIQDTGKALNQLTDSLSASSHQEVAEALAQGGSHVADAIAKAVADAGGSPEAQQEAIAAWQVSLANGGTLSDAQAQAIAVGLSADAGKAAGSVVTNAGNALVAKLSQGGTEAHEALSALTAGMPPEQSAAFTKGLLGALVAGLAGDALMAAAQASAAAATALASAQAVSQSQADALIQALASGANAGEALQAAGLGGNTAAAQALAAALSGGAGSTAALTAAAQAGHSETATLALASTGSRSALMAALASGGSAEEALQAAGLGGNTAAAQALAAALSGGADIAAALTAAAQADHAEAAALALAGTGSGSALMAALASGANVDQALNAAGMSGDNAMAQALSQALANGSSLDAAVAGAVAASDAAQAQNNAGSVPSSAGAVLAAALASGADLTQALSNAGLGGSSSQADAMIAAMTEALASGTNPADALASARQAGALATATVQDSTSSQASTVAETAPTGEPVPSAPPTATEATQTAAVASTPLTTLMDPVGALGSAGNSGETSPTSLALPPAGPPSAPVVTVLTTVSAPPTTPPSTTPSTTSIIPSVNHAPVAVADVASATEAGGTNNGTPGVDPIGNVLTNDTDADAGDTKTVSAFGSGTYGTLTVQPDGSYSYVVDNTNATVQALRTASDTLTDNISYTVRDTAGLTSSATLTVTIHGADDAPVAVADVASATEAGGTNNGTPGIDPTGNVLTNDTDVDAGDTKTVSALANGKVGAAITSSYGTLTLNADGSYTYGVDNANATVQALRTASGTLTETFTYTMQDTAGLTSSATLTVTIHGADDAPVAVADTASAIEAGGTNNGTPGIDPTGNVLTNDTDVDAGDTKTVSAFGSGTYGTLTIKPDGSYSYAVDNTNAIVQALRTASDILTDSISYTVRDTAGLTSSATLTVTIHGADDAPVAVADIASATEKGGVNNGTPGVDPSGNILTNDTDVDAGDTKIVSALAGGTIGAATVGTYGTLTLNGDGSYTYVVDNSNSTVDALTAADTLTETFTYTVRDAAGLTASATLTITIHGANDFPVVITTGGPGTITELANTTGSDTPDTTNGTVAFSDVDRPDGHSATAAYVSAVWTNHPTTDFSSLGALSLESLDNTAKTVGWTYSVSDRNLDFLAAGETLAINYTVSVSDGHGGIATQPLTVTIIGANDAPVVSVTNVTGSVTEMTSPLGNLTDSGAITFTDVDLTDVHAISTAAVGSHLGVFSAVKDSDTTGTGLGGQLTWTYSVAAADIEYLSADERKYETFKVTVDDGHGGAIDRTVTATVTGTNDAPTLTTVNTLAGAVKNTPFTISYATLAAAGNEADVDHLDVLSFRITAVSSGSLTKDGQSVVAGITLLHAGESLVWTPDNNDVGSKDAFTVKAFDGIVDSTNAVTVKVGIADVGTGFQGGVVNPLNCHYYQFYHTTDISWTNAEAAAERSTYLGIRGHLATITSESENILVSNLLQGHDAWIGGHGVLGDFTWVDTLSAIPNRHNTTIGYSNWNDGEPNNFGGLENSLEMFNSGALKGKWNDLQDSDLSHITSYVIEYDLPDPPLPSISENVVSPIGESISDLFGRINIDQIVIKEDYSTSDQGEWQYKINNGDSWICLNSNLSQSVTLNLDDSLRFVPTHNWNGVPGSLLVGLIEVAGGQVTAYDAITTSVTPVNDAPIASGTSVLAAVGENALHPQGAAISALFAANFSDAADAVSGGSAADTLAGIAIVGNGVNADQGAWQYSVDHGATWTTIESGVSDTAALTLAASDDLRFVPTPGFVGNPGTLTSHLIESGGAALVSGSPVDLSAASSVGGTSHVSAATVALTTTVTSPPVVDHPSALAFDGQNSEVVVHGVHNSEASSAQFTVEAWVQTSQSNGTAALIDQMSFNETGQSGYTLSLTNGSLQFDVGTGVTETTVRGGSIADGIWHHIAAIYNGLTGIAKIVIDATNSEAADVPSGRFDVSDTMTIGDGSHSHSASNYAGLISDLQFWNTDRSASLVQDGQRHLQGNEVGLTSYWKFDEGSDAIAYNSAKGHTDAIQTAAYQALDQKTLGPGELFKNMVLGTDQNARPLSGSVSQGHSADNMGISGNSFIDKASDPGVTGESGHSAIAVNNDHMAIDHIETIHFTP